MGERRMLSKKIIQSTKFLKMPITSQYLYMQLALSADDDGVVEAFNIMRLVGGNEDDLKILQAKKFIIVLNEDYITYIVDWLEHNLIRADRKKDSIYKYLLIKILPDIKLVEPRQRADRNNINNNFGTSHVGPLSAKCPPKISKDKISKYNIKEYSTSEKKITCDSVESPLNFSDIKNMFNSICARLPQIKEITDKRKKVLKNWYKQDRNLDLKAFFELVSGNDFLNGVNQRGWKANFDWIIKPENRIKIIENTYTTKQANKPIQATNYEQRKYSDEYFNSLYDNVQFINK